MKRILYTLIRTLAVSSRLLRNRNIYMFFLTKAHKINGVRFIGNPRFIHQNAILDASGGVSLGNNIVISTGVLLLTHDYSITTGLISINEKPITDIAIKMPIIIGDNCFIGANSTLLPGTILGQNIIVGAGSIVKGTIPDYSIIAGNPAKLISDIRPWIQKKQIKFNSENLIVDKN